uniref:Dual specificity protein phosphatase n=1 Tax=Gadus morhua TaxID=8049 RepID=A0A8C4ZU65_GADMO
MTATATYQRFSNSEMASNKSKSGRSTTAWQGAEASAQKEEYFTPGGYELEKILNRGSAVYTPPLASGKQEKKMGVTHVLNAAEGTRNSVNTGADYYDDMAVVYFGLVAVDVVGFDLSQYFYSAAKFIHEALHTLLVHCVMGRSRSATLFLAYLMIYHNMTVVDAVDHVKQRRRIIPNWGFLKQLRQLDESLQEKRKGSSDREGNDYS